MVFPSLLIEGEHHVEVHSAGRWIQGAPARRLRCPTQQESACQSSGVGSQGQNPLVPPALAGAMMDYGTWKLITLKEPTGRAALEKFVEQASDGEIEKLRQVVRSTPAALEHLASAIRTLELVLRDRGLL